ncbi:MAG TPA: NfeD family protein, partial [Opitutaceae bacterium]|nr:NfeD family protein [Opitutaceae bacterium]
VLQAALGTAAQVGGAGPEAGAETTALVGREGVVTTPLRPAGEVEVAGVRYQAQLELGSAAAGTRVVVVGCTDFGLKVEKLPS